jgi:sortase A
VTVTLVPPTPGAELPRAPVPPIRRPPLWRRLPWKRIGVLTFAAVTGLLVCLWAYERAVTQLIHDQRQRHLAAEFRVPAADATVRENEAIAVIQAPTIGLNEIVIEGDSTANLRSGPARRADSALPGETGRTVILGHRSAYGGPFARLDELVEGDTVVVQTRNGGPIVAYIVREVRTGDDAAELEPVDDGVAQLVLVTSQRGWFDGGDIVVVASTLPVIDAEATAAAVDVGPSDRGAPFGLDAIVANAAAIAAALAWVGLRGRIRLGLRIATCLPIAFFALVSYLSLLDAVLPATR